MRLRFFTESDGETPHVTAHGVTPEEVAEVVARPMEDRPGRDGARVAIGVTEAGRYLKVIYVRDPGENSAFVITAYDLGPRALRALRRRRRK